MSKTIKWKKINQYFSEKSLHVIGNMPFDFVKMLLIHQRISVQDNLWDIESFIECARKNYFTLSDLRNLNFSEGFIDEIAMKKYFSLEDIELITKMNWEEGKATTVIGRVYAECLDKSGNTTASHFTRIIKDLESEEERVVGLLHDIVEDDYLTFNNLRQFGFSESIIETVKILTRDKNKYPNYEDYINSIIASRNLTALKIKFWDMQDNQSPYRVNDLNKVRKEKATHKYKPYIPLVVLTIKEIEDEQNLERKQRLVT